VRTDLLLDDDHESDARVRLEGLYREFATDVHAYALRRVADDVAEDIVSDVFVVAWRRLDDVPPNALPWLLAVARKTISNYLRGDRRREALRLRLEHEGTPTVSAQLAGAALLALASLPEPDREALMLVAWEGLDSRSAASVLGCSPVAFRVRLHRARKKFRQALHGTSPRTPQSRGNEAPTAVGSTQSGDAG
jgi:RNA polymerase sigma factor (sigma-70 family)